MFDVTILTPGRSLFEGEALSVRVPGDEGEFEILELHRSVISLLIEGNIVIDQDVKIPIRGGVMNFTDTGFTALVEER